MEITIVRFRKDEEAVDGRLFVGSEPFCDTVENLKTLLPEGEYRIERMMCKHYGMFMPVVISNKRGGIKSEWTKARWCGCYNCHKTEGEVYANTTLPVVCPMLKAGNGVYNRADGSIIVGKRIVRGCLSHPVEVFDTLREQIRKAVARGKEVRLKISEEGL